MSKGQSKIEHPANDRGTRDLRLSVSSFFYVVSAEQADGMLHIFSYRLFNLFKSNVGTL